MRAVPDEVVGELTLEYNPNEADKAQSAECSLPLNR